MAAAAHLPTRGLRIATVTEPDVVAATLADVAAQLLVAGHKLARNRGYARAAM